MLPSVSLSAGGLPVLRSEIDRIDDQLLQLMEERLRCAGEVAALKGRSEPAHLRIRPRRESEVIARLRRHSRSIPSAMIASLWSELMGMSLQAQQASPILLHAPRQAIEAVDSLRRRFGSQARIVRADGPEEALAEAAEGTAIAVVELAPLSRWWTGLADGLVIFERLEDEEGRVIALVVGRLADEHLDPERVCHVIGDRELRDRLQARESIQVLAMWQDLRLCAGQVLAAPATEAVR